MLVLSTDILQDELAVLVARIVTTANVRAKELGVNVKRSVVTISQMADNEMCWRVSYSPKETFGHREGDLMIDVDSGDVSVKQVLRGQ